MLSGFVEFSFNLVRLEANNDWFGVAVAFFVGIVWMTNVDVVSRYVHVDNFSKLIFSAIDSSDYTPIS